MTPTDNFICFRCKHFKEISGGCDAFKTIPVQDILDNGHSKPLKGQDNDIVFEEGESKFE